MSNCWDFVIAKSWDKTIWKEPSRKTGTKEKLEFFSTTKDRKKVASVRLYLFSQDLYEYQDEKEGLSYADGNFYARGDLQADHLQSSEE